MSKIDIDDKIDRILNEVLHELSDNRDVANHLYGEFHAKWTQGSTDESTQLQLVQTLKNLIGTTDRRIKLLESLVKLKMAEVGAMPQQQSGGLTGDDTAKNEILKVIEEAQKKERLIGSN